LDAAALLVNNGLRSSMKKNSAGIDEAITIDQTNTNMNEDEEGADIPTTPII